LKEHFCGCPMWFPFERKKLCEIPKSIKDNTGFYSKELSKALSA